MKTQKHHNKNIENQDRESLEISKRVMACHKQEGLIKCSTSLTVEARSQRDISVLRRKTTAHKISSPKNFIYSKTIFQKLMQNRNIS